jgi:hypothetical protein
MRRERILRYGGAETVAPPTFTPADLPGLWAWYDAADAPSVRTGAGGAAQAGSGDPVSEWRDLSGNNRHLTQSTAAEQPTLQTATLRRLVFSGEHLDYVPGVALMQPITVFAVVKLDALATQQAILDATSGALALFFDVGIGTFRLFSGGASTIDAGTADTARHVLRAVYNGAASEAQIDNNATVTGSLGGNGLPGLRLGRNAALAAPLGGEISELIVVAGTLSPTDAAGTLDYLTDKWI